jgi:hypothetical protein
MGLGIPAILDSLGIADFNLVTSSPKDRSIIERACWVIDCLTLSCFIVWASAMFRIRYDILFDEKKGNMMGLLACGAAGCALLIVTWRRWMHQPFSGGHFVDAPNWEFFLGWILLWWAFVFWHGFSSEQSSDTGPDGLGND